MIEVIKNEEEGEEEGEKEDGLTSTLTKLANISARMIEIECYTIL